jgi:hypothetical protein
LSEPPGKCWSIALNLAATASFHQVANSMEIYHFSEVRQLHGHSRNPQ